MKVKAYTKYARMSPLKVRKVARAIQGRNAAEALEILNNISRKSARLIGKTLKSAISNAENNNNLSSDSLRVESLNKVLRLKGFALQLEVQHIHTKNVQVISGLS